MIWDIFLLLFYILHLNLKKWKKDRRYAIRDVNIEYCRILQMCYFPNKIYS